MDELARDNGSSIASFFLELQPVNLAIITYHGIETGSSPLYTSPTIFKAQLDSLVKNGYQSVSLANIVDWLKGAKTLPEKAVAITFDDGYASVYDQAWPLLREYDYQATVFLVTDYCGRDNRWPSQLAEVPEESLMGWGQIEELGQAGWEFGAHSKSHPPLPLLSLAQAKKEILNSKKVIARHTGNEPRVFAYPYGANSPEISAIVRRHFDGAVGVKLGVVSADSDIYYLDRIDSYYLSPRLIPMMERQVFRRYLDLRQRMRKIRRRYRTDWTPSFNYQA